VIVAESEVTGVLTEWSPHAHPMHELVWVPGGTLTSRVGNRIVTVPAWFGLWMPAGVVHGGRLTATSTSSMPSSLPNGHRSRTPNRRRS
jgi:quercetin dioxygenase-like cupin family protein